MDMRKTVREIGFLEAGANLAEVLESMDIREKVGAVMPLPDKNIINTISKIADWLTDFGKDKYMILTPEIALIDELAKQDAGGEAILLIPCDMDQEVKERLKVNIPKLMKVSLLEEPYFPQGFYPGNGLLIACGYYAGGRIMVLPETYRLIDHYSGFMGKKVFVPYVELEDAVRYDGWIEIGRDKFTAIWRDE